MTPDPRRPARRHRVAVIGGDGIGPEVVGEALRLLQAAGAVHGFTLDLTHYPHGAEHYLATGELFPPAVLDEIRGQDAIFLGALGDPRLEVGLLERAVILGLRMGLDLYINHRPVRLYAEHLCPIKGKTPSHIDILVVRENTEGEYVPIGGRLRPGTPQEVAVQEMVYTRHGVERCLRYAFERARARPRRHLTLVDKANAIQAQAIWTEAFAQVAAEYPDVQTGHAYIDAACMYLIKEPERFDTIVTPNLFGDILTDLGAEICGGLGIAASGNIHPGRVSMFEPVHGSAPPLKGRALACPLAAILAGALMLEHLGEAAAAADIEEAVRALLNSGDIRSLAPEGGHRTGEYTEGVLRHMATSAPRADR